MSPVVLTSVFMKDELKRLFELCNNEYWPDEGGPKMNLTTEELAALPDKVIWVDYSAEVNYILVLKLLNIFIFYF